MDSIFRIQPTGRLRAEHFLDLGYGFGSTPKEELVLTTTPDRRALVLTGVAADKEYSAAVAPYRNVDTDINPTGKIKGFQTVLGNSGLVPNPSILSVAQIALSISGLNNAAAAAQTDATAAIARINSISNDSILDRSEKSDIIQRLAAFTAEKDGIAATATALGITTEASAYTTSYNTLVTYLTSLIPSYTDKSTDTPIVRTTFDSRFNDYLSTRQAVLNQTSSVASTLANWSNVTGTGKPADNATSDITLTIATGTDRVTILGNTAWKNAGAPAWDSFIMSKEYFANSAIISFTLPNANTISMTGLCDAAPTAAQISGGSLYNALNYCVRRGTGSWNIYEPGGFTMSLSTAYNGVTFSSSTVWTITYDGVNTNYYADGVVMRTVAAVPNKTFYAGSAFYTGTTTPSVANMKITSFTDNNWASVGGTGKPADNATVGAPAGTKVGNTIAETVEKNAANSSNITMYSAISGDYTFNGNLITKAVGNGWTSAAFSQEFTTGAAQLSFKLPVINAFVGLDSVPSLATTNSYTSIDYAWHYSGGSSNWQIYESGTSRFAGTSFGGVTFGPNTFFVITYDGKNVKYWADAVLVRTVATTDSRTFYVGAALSTVGGYISNVSFGAYVDNSLVNTDPAARINVATTLIDPGKITISGTTKLSDWRNGTDATKIEGGSIAANTIDANKLTIGNRGITISGIQFQANWNGSAIVTNTIYWTGGTISYVNDSNVAVSVSLSAGSFAWTSGTAYFYWVQGATTLTAVSTSTTTPPAAAFAKNNIVLATYAGGINLNVNYGRTIIDGSQITTGTINASRITSATITAAQIAANTISTSRLAISDLTNFAANGDLSLGNVNWAGTVQTDSTNAYMGNFVITLPAGAGAKYISNDNVFTVKPGDQFYLEWWGKASSDMDSSFNVYLRINNAAGSQILTSNVGSITAADQVYRLVSGSITMPANAHNAYLQVNYNNTVGTGYIGMVRMRRKNEGALIVDGAITAQKLVIGQRGVDIASLNFQANYDIFSATAVTNRVSWNGGTISYTNDAGTAATVTIPAASTNFVNWTSGIIYLYWTIGATTISNTTSNATAYATTNVVLATYAGGTNLNVTYGGTIIDGSKITTGTIDANKLIANSVLAGTITVGGVGGTNTLANAFNTATWASVSSRPANVAALTGTEGIQNSQIIVGGTNLIKKSDYAPATGYTSSGMINGKSGWGLTLVKVTTNVVAYSGYRSWPKGQDITLSYVAWVSAGTCNMTIDLYPDTLPETGVTLTTTPTKYTWTINSSLSDMGNASHRFFLVDSTSNNDTIYITDIKWELGNKATDWSPSPNDPDALRQAGYSGDLAATSGAPTGTYVGTQLAQDLVTDVSNAKLAIGNISNDNVLSINEKSDIIREWNRIDSSKNNLRAQLISFGLSNTNIDTAYTNLGNYLLSLSPAWSDTTQNSPIDGPTFRQKFQDFYTQETNAISLLAGTAALRSTWSGVTGVGRPADNATVGATAGVNLLDSVGVALTDGTIKNSQANYQPIKAFTFDSTVEGFNFGNASATATGGTMTVTGTSASTNPIFISTNIATLGSQIPIIRMRARPLHASPTMNGAVYYETQSNNHGQDANYYKRIASPGLTQNVWQIFEWDMSALSAGGTDWMTQTITRVRFDMGNQINSIWEIDWISFGAILPAGIMIGTMKAEAIASTVNNLSSDNIISIGEKSELIVAYDQATAAKIQASTASSNFITIYGEDGTNTQRIASDTALTSLQNYLAGLNPAWNDVTQNTPVDGPTLRSYFQSVQQATNVLLNANTAYAATRANWTKVTGVNKPADNAGANFNLYSTGSTAIVVQGNSVTRTAAGSDFTSIAASREYFFGAAYASFTLPSTGTDAGLSTNGTPTTREMANYTWHNSSSGGWRTRNGTTEVNFGSSANGVTFSSTTQFLVQYDGTKVIWLADGVTMQTVAVGSGLLMKLVVVIATVNAIVPNLQFGPYTDNSWVSVAGTGKPQDNATLGAPAGTYVGTMKAEDIVSTLSNITADGILSKSEKSVYMQMYGNIQASYIEAGNTSYAFVSTYGSEQNLSLRQTADNAYSSLNTYLNSLSPAWNDVTTDTVIDGNAFRNQFQTLVQSVQNLATSNNAIASQKAVWSGVQGTGKPETYTIGSKGNQNTQNLPSGYLHGLRGSNNQVFVDSYNSTLRSDMYARSYTLCWRVSADYWAVRSYDVYGNSSAYSNAEGNTAANSALNLATQLNQGIAVGTPFVIYTSDEPANNRLSAGLADAMYRCGASRTVFGSSGFTSWSSYVLIGTIGIGEGNGLELMAPGGSSSYVMGSFSIVNGIVMSGGKSVKDATDIVFSTGGRTVDVLNSVQAGATVGAPTGTNVGSTPAATVEAQSANSGNITLYDAVGSLYVIFANKVLKSGATAWNGNVYSREYSVGTAQVSGILGVALSDTFIGLSDGREALTSSSYNALDYSWHNSSSGQWFIYESGTGIGMGNSNNGITFDQYTLFQITYDGLYVKYYANGVLMRSTNTTVGRVFYAGVSVGTSGNSVTGISFGPNVDNSLANTDPAARINIAATTINPGRINIQGSTTLADWKAGTNLTTIAGGKIEANTVSANKMSIGLRGVDIQGIEFTANWNVNVGATNVLTWTAGSITYWNDAGVATVQAITAGTTTWSSGLLYVYWIKGQSSILANINISSAYAVDNIVLATYTGGTNLVVNYGRTIIDGSKITTGTIQAAQIAAGAISAANLYVGATTEGLLANGGGEVGTGDGWQGQGSVVTGGNGSTYCIAIPPSSGSGYLSKAFPVTQGKTYTVTFGLRGSVAIGSGIYFRMLYANAKPAYTVSGSSYNDLYSSGGATTSWVTSTYNWTAPVGATWVSVVLYNTTSTGTAYFDDIQVFELVNGTRIADGAISTNKMSANSINGDRISAGTINANQLSIASRPLSTIGINFRVNADNTTVSWDAGEIRYVDNNNNTIYSANSVAASGPIPYQGAHMYFFYAAGRGLIDYNTDSSNLGNSNVKMIAIWKGGTDLVVMSGVGTLINGDRIVTGSIDANRITANSILSNFITVQGTTGNIGDAVLRAADPAARINATTTTIDGGKITTGTITARQITLGNTDSIIPDADMRDVTFWVGENPTTSMYVGTQNGGWAWRRYLGFNGNAGAFDRNGRSFPVEPGATYKISVGIYVGNMNSGGWFNAAIQIPGVIWYSLKNSAAMSNPGVSDATNGFTTNVDSRKSDFILTNPAGVTNNTTREWNFRFAGNFTGYVEFMVTITRISDTTLIQDGAITTNKITVNSLNADRILGGTITGDKISTTTSLPGSITVGNTGVQIETMRDAAQNSGNATWYEGDGSVLNQYTFAGNKVRKLQPAAWTASAYTRETYFGGCTISGRMNNDETFFGISSSRAFTNSEDWRQIAYGFHRSIDGNYYAYESGNQTQNFGNAQNAAVPYISLSIVYDGRTVRWYSNGNLLRETATTENRGFGGAVSIGGINKYVDLLSFSASTDNSLLRTDPASRINANSTNITPGRIQIQGSTTLNDWRNGSDSTEIRGGAIAANTINANKLTIGNRGIAFIGLNFEWRPTDNKVYWDGGFIYYTDSNGTRVSQNIQGGNTGSLNSHRWFMWKPGRDYIDPIQVDPGQDDQIILGAWWGGNNLNITYGGTIVNGGKITTGTITADKISVASLSAISANIGSITAGVIRSPNDATFMDMASGYFRFGATEFNIHVPGVQIVQPFQYANGILNLRNVAIDGGTISNVTISTSKIVGNAITTNAYATIDNGGTMGGFPQNQWVDFNTTSYGGGGSDGGSGGGAGGGGGACPVPNTPILLANDNHTGPGETIMAGELRADRDWVWTQHEYTMEWGAFKVTHAKIVKSALVHETTIDGKYLCASFDHPVWVNDRWTTMAELSGPCGKSDVVLITVDNAHTYISNGILSHNKVTNQQQV